jgi:hypothetical protein
MMLFDLIIILIFLLHLLNEGREEDKMSNNKNRCNRKTRMIMRSKSIMRTYSLTSLHGIWIIVLPSDQSLDRAGSSSELCPSQQKGTRIPMARSFVSNNKEKKMQLLLDADEEIAL